MSNNVQISIKLDRELLDEFSGAAASMHCPEEQIIQELMRHFIKNIKIPSKTTAAAIQQVENGEVFSVSDFDDMLQKCGVNVTDKAHV